MSVPMRKAAQPLIARSTLVLSRNPAFAPRAKFLTSPYGSSYTPGFKRGIASSELKVSPSRLWNDIHSTCQWGKGQSYGSSDLETGMCRLSLSDSDKKARDWFAETTSSLGCKVEVDEMGNMFAVRPGRNKGLPTYAGSHLDTQPTGGRFDGILGVTAGVEMLRVLQDANYETEYPVGVINWTNEEGARFPKSMVSSGVWAQKIPLEDAHNLKSVVRGENATMKSELERIGYLGPVPCSFESTPMAAHFELHIEQGPILENEGRKVGIVAGVQAYRWFTITVTGRDSHTGTTDLASRADALLVASRMIVEARLVAHENNALASVGIIEAKPGSTNTVPGTVNFSLDVRAMTDEVLERTEKALRQRFDEIANEKQQKVLADPVTHEWRLDFENPATHFHEDCIKCVTEGAKSIYGEQTEAMTKSMYSGAGHDSVYTSKHAPTSMVFVPSRGGVSHNPSEWTSEEDCGIGAQVLMQAVLNYDQLRAQRA